MFKSVIRVLVVVACVPTLSFSQIDVRKPIPSPESASLAKFVEVPVSTFNGIPSVSIPLYEVVDGDIRLPITLNYHAGGIRVNEEASMVGLGFSLSAGGEIIFDGRGEFDLNGGTGYRQVDYPLPIGDGDFTSAHAHFKNSPNGQFLSETGQSRSYCDDPLNVRGVDGEPDFYIFNFLQYSGKFIFKRNYNAQGPLPVTSEVIDQQPIRFTRNSSTLTAYTPNGFEFVFGSGESSHTQLVRGSGTAMLSPLTNPVTSSFKLTSIKSALGRMVTIEYVSPSQKVLQAPNISFSKTTKKYMASPGALDDNGTVSHTWVSTKYPEYIRFTNGFIKFIYSTRLDITNAFKLDAIEIYKVESTTSTKIKTIAFTYDYFLGSATFGDYYTIVANDPFYPVEKRSKRLRLLNVKIGDEEPYTFQYSTDPLPYKTSFAVDYWGFFNGMLNNTTLLPSGSLLNQYTTIPDVYISFQGANREPNGNFLKAGMLTSITYPTKGRTSFFYEPNTFNNLGSIKVPATMTAVDMDIPSMDHPVSDEVNLSGLKEITVSLAGEVPSQLGQLYVRLQRWNTTTSAWETTDQWDMYNYSQDCVNDPNGKCSPFYPGTYLFQDRLWLELAGKYRLVAKFPDGQGATEPGRKFAQATLYYTTQQDVSLSLTGPGVRVSKIVDDPLPGETITRLFTYKNGRNTSMPTFTRTILGFNQPQWCGSVHECGMMLLSPEKSFCGDENAAFGGFIGPNPGYSISSSLIPGYSNSANGSCIGYANVEVEYLGKDRGKTEYKYRISEDELGGDAPFPPGLPTANRLDNGKLEQEIAYRYDPATLTYSSVKTTTTTYDFFNKKLGWGFKVENEAAIALCNSTPTFTSCFTSANGTFHFYPIKMAQFLPIKTVVEEHIGSNTVSTSTDYTYNELGFVKSTTVKNSDGKQLTTELTYPMDYTQVTTGWISDMKNKNMIEPAIETIEKVDGLVSAATYQDFELHDGIITPKNSYQVETTQLISNFGSSAPAGSFNSSYTLRASLQTDAIGNIRSITNANNITTSFLWGYNNRYPVARVENAAPESVYVTSFEDDGIAFVSPQGINLAKTGKKVWDSGSFSFAGRFSPPNVTNLKMTYWYWNGTSWLFSGVLDYSSSITAGQKLDEIRVFPADAVMTTYTYDVLVGITTVTDPNQEVTYYKYDSNGRLINVTDDDGNLIKALDYNYKK